MCSRAAFSTFLSMLSTSSTPWDLDSVTFGSETRGRNCCGLLSIVYHSLLWVLNNLIRENLLGDSMLNRDGDLWKTVPFVSFAHTYPKADKIGSTAKGNGSPILL